uniref:Putative ovule protein n=1 Tax=Solanum chacoense TaxID=4108 RepID=A0A0V0HMR8_SOLCH
MLLCDRFEISSIYLHVIFFLEQYICQEFWNLKPLYSLDLSYCSAEFRKISGALCSQYFSSTLHLVFPALARLFTSIRDSEGKESSFS